MPLDTVICLDTSGSMAGRPIRELKQAALKFVEGVEETAREHSVLKENVAVIEFGKNQRILQTLTNDYGKVKVAIRSLDAGGRTPMVDGLILSLQEILKNGGVVTVSGRPLTPRILLFTDGKPTDEEGETLAAKLAVLKTAAAFGPKASEFGLPHKVPIACVGCGDCDPELLEGIAKISGGMFTVMEKIDQLSDFFRRQVLLIRFVAQFEGEARQLRDALLLKAFLESRGEAVRESELTGLHGMLLTLLGLGALADVLEEASSYPPHGSRVRRGKDWKWGNQDDGGPGTVSAHKPGGVIEVTWDNGKKNSYRHGAEDAHDLEVIDEPRMLTDDEVNSGVFKVGVKVKRGPDWKWGDQDSHPGNTGMVFEIEDTKWAKVQWKDGRRANYRYGADESYDLEILRVPGHSASAASQKMSPQTVKVTAKVPPAETSLPAGLVSCWQWQDDDFTWRLYTEAISDGIEEQFHKNSKGTCTAKITGNEYTIDFNTMKQTNKKTSKCRLIRRTSMAREDHELAKSIEAALKIQDS